MEYDFNIHKFACVLIWKYWAQLKHSPVKISTHVHIHNAANSINRPDLGWPVNQSSDDPIPVPCYYVELNKTNSNDFLKSFIINSCFSKMYKRLTRAQQNQCTWKAWWTAFVLGYTLSFQVDCWVTKISVNWRSESENVGGDATIKFAPDFDHSFCSRYISKVRVHFTWN